MKNKKSENMLFINQESTLPSDILSESGQDEHKSHVLSAVEGYFKGKRKRDRGLSKSRFTPPSSVGDDIYIKNTSNLPTGVK